MAITGTDATGVQNEEVIDPRCIVKFRPGDDWVGQYGFDWFREGDYGELFADGSRGKTKTETAYGNSVIVKSNSHYKKDHLVGKYHGRFYLCKGNVFNPEVSPKKDEFSDTNGNTIYTTYTTSNGTSTYTTFHVRRICNSCNSRLNCPILPSSLNNGNINGKEFPVIDEHTQKNMKIDPDLGYETINSYLVQWPSFDNHNPSGTVLYEKELEKYYALNIQSLTSYYVPTISLFYRNESKESEGKWGQSKAAIKMLISGDNIETDIKNINFEFECSIGIEIMDSINQMKWQEKNEECDTGVQLVDSSTGKPINKILGTTINKNPNTNYYEKEVSVKLTEDYATFSVKEGDGVIRLFAENTSTMERFLVGKMFVEKCIPKSVDVVLVHVPVETNSKISHFPNISYQEESLKRFLGQAHIIPNIKTINIYRIHSDTKRKLALVVKLNAILDAHRGTTNKDVLSFNQELIRQLETLFNDECHGYTNAYKLFLLGAKGDKFIGLAGGVPSKSAVISNETKISTVCHELLHCFGLFHSFSNNSPYTFEQYRTSNIMDYPLKMELLTLWRWQWHIIREAKGMNNMEIQNQYKLAFNDR